MNSLQPQTAPVEILAPRSTWLANRRLAKLRRRAEHGATAVEYALMVGLIAVGIIGAVVGLRDKTSKTFNNVGAGVEGNSATVATTTAPAGPVWTDCANDGGVCILPGSPSTQYSLRYTMSSGFGGASAPFTAGLQFGGFAASCTYFFFDGAAPGDTGAVCSYLAA